MTDELRMNAYYYSFDPTGVVEIDRVLSAVACAGKGDHHTMYWSDEGESGTSPIARIQKAAVDAATELARIRAQLDGLAEHFDKRSDDQEDMAHRLNSDTCSARAEGRSEGVASVERVLSYAVGRGYEVDVHYFCSEERWRVAAADEFGTREFIGTLAEVVAEMEAKIGTESGEHVGGGE